MPFTVPAQGFAWDRATRDSPKFVLRCAGRVVTACWAKTRASVTGVVAYFRFLWWALAACANDLWKPH